MPDTMPCSPATVMSLPGNSAGSALPRTLGAKPLKFNGTSYFRGERRRALFAPRKSRGLLTHRKLRCNMTKCRAGDGHLTGEGPAGTAGPGDTQAVPDSR